MRIDHHSMHCVSCCGGKTRKHWHWPWWDKITYWPKSFPNFQWWLDFKLLLNIFIFCRICHHFNCSLEPSSFISLLTVPVFKNTSCSFCCTQTKFELIINKVDHLSWQNNTKVCCWHIFGALYPVPGETNKSLKPEDTAR